MKKIFCSLLHVLWVLSISVGQTATGQTNRTHDLMPVPESVSSGTGHLVISNGFRIAITGNPDPRVFGYASRFIRRLSEKTGIFLDKQGFVTSADTNRSSLLQIHIVRPGKIQLNEDESYTIQIDDHHVRLDAPNDIGALRGLETLLQLVSNDDQQYYFPELSIKDSPRFPWRGLLLDVALHFMPVDMICRTLDGMAAVKMNVLHLHLSNDQGFRVESTVFPRLQQVASDGKYYTQQQIKEIIRYAADRGIRIVPEFVMPAHTTAILTAFPEFASKKRAYSLERYFGVFDPVLDPTNEKMWVFLSRLLAEMTALFPDRYFHIGGDENTGKDWEQSASISAYMKTHGMTEYMELQTAFNKRLLPILAGYHKTMMGWDEILQPGVPKEIVIQSWRGKEAFYTSVKKGYKAILSNGYYIDLIQPASFHYANDPVPDSVHLTPEEKNNILGGEATMWSELVTPETVDSRIWPRTGAIAERLWSPASVKDPEDMYRRLDILSLELESIGLRHESYKPAMYRRLANGNDYSPVETLINVIEPLKIYERNQGDTMYTVFSPYTKIADAAVPDQRLPRLFAHLVDSFLTGHRRADSSRIVSQLTIWRDNDSAFRRVASVSPILNEGLPLSTQLNELSGIALAAMEWIGSGRKAGEEWLAHAMKVVADARGQAARCELQIADPIEKLVHAAAGQTDTGTENKK